MVQLGVGKNMVASIRYWTQAFGLIARQQSSGLDEPTELGTKLLGVGGIPTSRTPVHSGFFTGSWQVAPKKPRRGIWRFHSGAARPLPALNSPSGS